MTCGSRDSRESSDAGEATTASSQAERNPREKDQKHLEIVLVEADSIEAIRKTHSAHFGQLTSTSGAEGPNPGVRGGHGE